MSIFGPPNIEKLKTKKDVKRLQKALFYANDAFIRRWATKALGDLGDPKVSDSLVQVIKSDESKMVKYGAATALARLKDPRAVEPLIFLAIKSRMTQKVDFSDVIDLIADIGEPAVIELTHCLHHRYDNTHAMAVAALKCIVRLGSKDATGAIISYIKLCNAPLGKRTAVWALGELRDSNAIKVVLEATLSLDTGVRNEASIALEKLGLTPEAPDLSIDQKISLYVNNKEIGKIVALGDEAVDSLNRHLNKNYKGEFSTIAQALGRLKSPRSLPFLIQAFAYTEERSAENKALINAIKKFGKSAVNDLLNAVKNVSSPNDNNRIRPAEEAANILAAMHEQRAIRPLINMLDLGGIAQSSAEKALIKFDVVEPLINELKKLSRTQNRLTGVVNTISAGGYKEAIPHLIEVLRKKNRKLTHFASDRIYCAIRNLSGEDFGEDLQAWEEWWNKNKDKLS